MSAMVTVHTGPATVRARRSLSTMDHMARRTSTTTEPAHV